MGMIGNLFSMFFGGGGNVIKKTAEVFRPNAEQSAQRNHEANAAALAQFAAEFGHKGWFNQFVDGLNRLPRPLMAFGVIGLFASAMFDPIWFAARMQGLLLVPEQLWVLFGLIVSFYFGVREIQKFREAKALMNVEQMAAQASTVAQNVSMLEGMRGRSEVTPDIANFDVGESDANPALEAWKKQSQDK